MLRIDRKNRSLAPVERKRLGDAGLKERTDVQAMIRANPNAFFEEIGERLLLLGEEVKPSLHVTDRIDLLAIDENGSLAVIELKRGTDKLQLLQALTYAAMISSWTLEQALAECAKLTRRSTAEAKDDLGQFLPGGDLDTVNRAQRVLLIAEEFDWEVLATSRWLTESHGLDIRCYRLALSVEGELEYLTCTCIYPPAELDDHVRGKRKDALEVADPQTWEEVFSDVENAALVSFFKKEVEASTESLVRYGELIYRYQGRRVFWVDARQKHAYVWQGGRFEDDESYWKRTLEAADSVRVVREGTALSFRLTTPKDFEAFREFITKKLPSVGFHSDPRASHTPA
jgi:hypothetical protein